MAIPFGNLQVVPRVFPQAPPNILGQLLHGWDSGRQVFQQNEANRLAGEYAAQLTGQPTGPTLGNLAPVGYAPPQQPLTAPVAPVTRQPIPPVGGAPYDPASDPDITGWTPPATIPPPAHGTPYATPNAAMEPFRDAITGIESGGNYQILGPVTASGDRAYGRYQIMGANIPAWTEQALGYRLTPEQFVAPGNEEAQDAVFDHIFGRYVQQYGPEGAARAWFTGSPTGTGTDILGTSADEYVSMFNGGLSGQPQTPVQAVEMMANQPASRAQAAAYAQGTATTPFAPQEQRLLSALAANPNTRELAFGLIEQRLATPAGGATDPVVINGQLVDRLTGRVLGDYRDQAAGGGPQFQRYQDPTTGATGMLDTTTGDIQWDPEHIQPGGATAAEAPDIRTLVGPDGVPHDYGWNPVTQRFDIDFGLADPGGQWGVTVAPDGTIQMTQGRGTGAATQDQANANIYATRMEASSPIIDEFAASGQNLWSRMVSGLGVVGNIALQQLDPEYQLFAQAVRDFINASLRRESGATITPAEFANAQQQYIPMPGDTPETLEQKRQNRLRQITGIRQASGPFAGDGTTPAAAGPVAPGTYVWTPDAGLVPAQ